MNFGYISKHSFYFVNIMESYRYEWNSLLVSQNTQIVWIFIAYSCYDRSCGRSQIRCFLRD